MAQGTGAGLVLRYKQVEAALADIANVKPRAMGAFRGKLRHLRNIGLPRLPSPGTGQRIPYSRRQVFEMLLAIELEKMGQAPKSAAMLAQSIVRQAPNGQHQGQDFYVAIGHDQAAAYTAAYGMPSLSKAIENASGVCLVINVSACAMKLDRALDRVAASG